jgi:hypothetical protein
MVSLVKALPIEVVGLIIDRFRRPDDSLVFAKTCVGARQAVHQYFQFRFRRHLLPGTTWLFGEQLKGLLTLERDRDRNLFLQAPMGQGKTLLAIMWAVREWKERGYRTMIVIPPKTLTSWRDEFKKRGFKIIGTRPQESDILVCHSKCRQHKIFIESTPAAEFTTLKQFILLTTTSYISRGRNHVQALYDIRDIYDHIIIDEAHQLNTHHYLEFLRPCKHLLYLSACMLEPTFTLHGETYRIYDRHVNLECEFDHHVEMRWQMIPVDLTASNLVGNIISFLRSTNSLRKLVLFTDWNPANLATCVKFFRERVPDWEWFRFYNTSLASLEKWRREDRRSILVTSILSATEGTNFEMADGAIYLNFGGLVVERARQCFGRIRRRTNPNSVVYNYLFYDAKNSVDYLRTRLNAYYATNLSLKFMRKKNHHLRFLYDLMSSEGIHIDSLTEADMITIFGLLGGDSFPYSPADFSLPVFDVLRYANVGWK